MTDPNERAFPCPASEGFPTAHGLTVREYFAAMALQALISRSGGNVKQYSKYWAESAVSCADALILALNDS